MSTLAEALRELRVLPVVEVVDAGSAVGLARALARGGLPAMEITLRTDAALDAIRAVAREVPDVLVGAGTLLTPDDVRAATDAGAQFLVSPGRTPRLSAAAGASGLPYVPGVASASEAMAAVEAGHQLLKVFPAEHVGGAAGLRALAAPLRASGVEFLPTGGIRPATLASYLSVPEVVAVGGTWVTPRDLVDEQDHDAVAALAAAAVAAARSEDLVR